MENKNEIIVSTVTAPSKFSFKNAKLNELSGKIAQQTAAINALYNDAKDKAERINQQLAPIFGELLSTKCYKDDGFKSVADYAEQTFGMGKSMAYMLARVGKEFYGENADFMKDVRAKLSTAKLAELTGVDRVQLAKDVQSGAVNEQTTLQQCREYATTHQKKNPSKPKVLPTYTVKRMGMDEPLAENVLKEDMYKEVANYIVYGKWADSEANVLFESIKLDGDKPSAAQHFIAYTAAGFTRMFEYRPYVKKGTGAKSQGVDKFDIMAYLRKLSPEQLAELVDSAEAEEEEEG